MNMTRFRWSTTAVICLIVFAAVSATDDVVVQQQSTMREACRHGADGGMCLAYIEMFAFNPLAGQCEMFVYGGCPVAGNANVNRFDTLESCAEYCKLGACSEVSCMMECPTGFSVDSDGCRICECLPGRGNVPTQTSTPQPPPVSECPLMKCPAIYCPNGFARDARGCQTCKCAADASPTSKTGGQGCPSEVPMCEMYCEFGLKRDENGCTVCECNSAPPTCPPEVALCDMHCPNGMKKDANGCTVCQCNDDSTSGCSPLSVNCNMYCEHGMKKDANGCTICECSETPAVCPPACNMYCANGMKKDTNGCDTCECNDTPASCPLSINCNMYCEHGMKKDANGCSLCECMEPPSPVSVTCPASTCKMFCENGMKKDASGCPICACNECPEKSPMCTIYCPNGMDSDEHGCPVCRCKSDASSPSPCPNTMCMMYCEHGFQTDANGCQLCRCKNAPVCPVDGPCKMFCRYSKNPEDGTGSCRLCRCSRPPLMEALCYGMLQSSCNVKGCPHQRGAESDPENCENCLCEDDPCLNVKCGEDMKCIVNYESFRPVCIAGRHWCPDAMCRKYCEFGFQTDEFGCEICRCRSQPKEPCVVVTPEHSDTSCEFGKRFDESGCRTSECIAKNPCTGFNCSVGTVCEAFHTNNCQECPAVPRCIAHDQVQYVKISVGYIHSASVMDDRELANQFQASMIAMLEVPKDAIQGVTVDWNLVPYQVVLSFSLMLSPHKLREDPTLYVNKLITEMNQAESSVRVLKVGSTEYFEPQPQTIQAAYYSTDYVAAVTVYHSGHHAGIMAFIVLGGLVFVVAVVGLTLLVCRRQQRKTRSTPIYKKTPQSDSSNGLYA